jgi:hypothetical protein
MCVSRDSSVIIAAGYGLDDRGIGVRVRNVETGPGAHRASYPVDDEVAFSRG